MNPRIRASVLLPCLLAALSLAVPAQAVASWASMTPLTALTCNGTPGDPSTAAVDTTPAPPAGWQGAPVGVTLNATGAQHMEYMVDCATPAVTAPMGTTVTMPEGTHTLSHRAVDAGGLATNWVDETVQVDTTTPTNTTADASGWHNAAVNVAVQGSDATSSIGHVDWTLDGTPGSGVSGATVNVSGDGTHSLTTSVTDQGGHSSAPRTDTIRIDTVLPADATTYPTGWQYAPTTVDLYGTDAGSGVDHVEWKLDGASTASTGPNHSSIAIPEGTHTLATQIVDLAGNASGWTTHTVQVDLTGPQDTTTVTAGWSTTSPQVITVKGTDPGGAGIQQVQWDVDGGAIAGSGANNSTVTIAADGDHVLKTRVTDGSGTWSSWKTQHVQIDTVLPTDTTYATPGWQTAPLNVTVTGTDATSGIQHVEYELDTATTPTVVVGTSAAITVSGDGSHTLKTRVFDNAGNFSGWKLQTIAIDTTAPANTTTAPPSGWITGSWQATANMADGGSGIGRMTYHVDANPDTQISPLTTVSVTGNGQHTLTTTAYDAAGNSSTRTDTIKIDNLAPTDTTVAPSGAVANHTQIAVTGSDSDSGVDHVEWYVDNGTPVQGGTAQIDGIGPHTLHTRVWDQAGNTSGWRTIPVTVSVSGDTTPPTDTSTTASGWYITRTVPFTVSATDTASDIDHVEWRVGGADGSIQQGPSGTVVQITGDGSHHVETRAKDGSGNWSPWRAQTVKIDSVIPVDTTSLPTGWTSTNTFTLSGTDATSGIQYIEYSVDHGPTLTVPSGTAIPALGDGTHTISHRAWDNAGQASDPVDSVVKIDTTAPTNTSPAAPTGWQHSILLALTGTDAAGGSGFDHGEWATVAPGNLCPAAGDASWQPGPASLTADGSYTLCTRAVDAAGNASGTRSETVKIDNTPPVNTTGAPATHWLADTFNTTVSGTDPASGVARVEWRLDSTTATPQTTSAVSVSAAGPHVLYTRIVDAAGNISDWRADSFGIDRTPPTLSVSCGSDAWRTAAAGCAVSADGGESGVGAVTVSRNGGPATAVNPAAGYGIGDDGDWYLSFRAVDGAGNARQATAHVRIDKSAPAAGLTCAADSGTGYTCSARGSDATSGLASLTYTVDGGAPQSPGPDGSFSVAKGHVVAHATDVAGNAVNSVGLILSNRIVPVTAPPRSVSEAVLRSGHGSVLSRALGEIALSATPSRSSVDLRPLAVGSGRFQITMTLRADKLRKKYTKVVTSKKGYTPRVSFHTGAGVHVTVDLTVRKRSGKRWRTYASGGAELGR